MRKSIHGRMLDLIDTVIEAAKYNLFEDCDFALQSIEETLRESLSNEGFEKYKNILNVGSLNKLKDLLKEESEVKKEIVFFPYKVAMWDSLESVWLAAKDDPACFVSVVPIPYYERENDYAVMHYEGNMYPDYVQIVDYRNYDLATELPDVAYIHNIYDNRNIVTMVEQKYFTRNLKEYVKCLVYIPYYASNMRPGPAFAAAPAACLADVVVASSEIDKRAYLAAGVWQDIAVLGSPKVDKIVNMEQTKPELPPGWENLRGKKVFFLNTSVNSMLKRSEFYFEKLKALFDIFNERDDIALIWRPHPLTQATISSMRPSLQNQYKSLENFILKGSFGVLDMSAEMSITIALSDAYIGDGASSLVYLYALTGKPMYILNFKLPITPEPEQLEEMMTSGIISWSAQTEGSEEWGVSDQMNALYKIDLATASATFVDSFPDEKNIAKLYNAPIKIGNKLIFSPSLAREWAFYDIESREWEKRPIPEDTIPEKKGHGAFRGGKVYGNNIIFLPGVSGITARYDMDSDRFYYYDEMKLKYKQYIVNINWGIVSGSCRYENLVYITSRQCNVVTELNMKTMQFKFFKVGSNDNRYHGVTFTGNSFWFTKFREYGSITWNEGFVEWNRKTLKSTEYNNIPAKQFSYLFEASGFKIIKGIGDTVFAFPYQADSIVKIDVKTKKMERFNISPPYDFFEKKSPYYTHWDEVAFPFVRLYKNIGAIIKLPYDYSYMTIDLETGECGERKKWKIEGITDRWNKLDRLLPYPWREQIFHTPKDFIDKVILGQLPAFDESQVEYYRAFNVNSDGTCGAKVHEYIMEKFL